MGITDFFSEIYTSFGLSELHAEAKPEEEEKDEGGDDGEEKPDEGKDEEKSEGEDGGDDKEEGGDEGGEEGGNDAEEEEEEEEEDEPVDPKPKLEAECARSAQCAPLKHHYDACADRVRQQSDDEHHKGPKENCVEEFFHLQHCATQCAAPKLFRQLK